MVETNKRMNSLVLGVDPGTTTGLAVVKFDPAGRPTFDWCDQLGWNDACDAAETRLGRMGNVVRSGRWADYVAAACEQFTLNAQSAQRGQKGADDAIGMNGVVRRACRLAGVFYAKPETASAAKNLISDTVLKSLDLYAVGMRHANDAMRHALLHGIKSGRMDKNLLALALR